MSTARGLRTARIPLSWRTWAAVAAGGWSLVYLLLGCYWWAGGSGYPFGRNDEAAPTAGSLLTSVDADAGAPVIVLAALASVLLAWVMDERRGTGWRRSVVIAAGWVVALFPVLVVIDSRSITLLPPLGVVGWTMIEDWPHLNQLLIAIGVLLWIRATTAYVGNTRARDARALEHQAHIARRWMRAGRVARAVACLCPVPYIVIRCSWALGLPIGAPPSFVDMLSRNQPGVALMEVVLALFASTGVLLTWGLGRRWGRIFPSWLPGIGDLPVPLWFPVSFATCAAVAIFPFGRSAWYPALGVEIAGSQDDAQLWGFDPGRSEFWGVGGLGWLFPLWAIALAVAATGYYYRHRPQPDEPSDSHNRPLRTPPTSLTTPTVRTSKAKATR